MKSSKISCIFLRLRTDNSLLDVTKVDSIMSLEKIEYVYVTEDPIHFIIHYQKYKYFRDLLVINMTNLIMKIEKNYPNKIIQLLFNLVGTV